MSGDLVAQARRIQERFTDTWTLDTRDLSRPSKEQILNDLIAESTPDMAERLKSEFFSLGPLQALADDLQITEIVVNGAEDIWFEKNGRWHTLGDRFLTAETFKNLVDRLCTEAELKVDLSEPFADGRWGDFRVHVACAPLVHCDFHLTLRRLPRHPWTLTDFVQNNWATPEQMNVLTRLIQEKKNMLFIGPTGSGKTSALGATLKSLPAEERVVIVEDTDELPRPNSASTKLLTRPHTNSALREVNLTELVKQSLRMRPMRLVVGEVRGAEAKDLLLALATGHGGSLGTLHASDPRQALLRLEMLVQMGAPQWNVQAIRQLLHLSVDAIIVCENKNGHRRLGGIHKVAALETFGFLFEQIA